MSMRLLEITASNRHIGSLSRSLSTMFIDAWQQTHPSSVIIQRDVGQNPPGHPSQLMVEAKYIAPADLTAEMVNALAQSEALIAEFLSADRLVIASPMYNFTIPSTLKAYFDNIVWSERTFSINLETFEFSGLATNKRALIIATSGGDYSPGSPAAAMDFFVPYLQNILGFMGIRDVTVVSVPNQGMPDPVRSDAVELAQRELLNQVAKW